MLRVLLKREAHLARSDSGFKDHSEMKLSHCILGSLIIAIVSIISALIRQNCGLSQHLEESDKEQIAHDTQG